MTSFDDLAATVRAFAAGGRPVTHVRQLVCPECQGTIFHVYADDDEGVAGADCDNCRHEIDIADSAEHFDESEPGECTCPCGGTSFAVAVGFAVHPDDGEVRWVSVGLDCQADHTLGVYVDWKIDYAPTGHLLTAH